jgi:hypothetical protein
LCFVFSTLKPALKLEAKLHQNLSDLQNFRAPPSKEYINNFKACIFGELLGNFIYQPAEKLELWASWLALVRCVSKASSSKGGGKGKGKSKGKTKAHSKSHEHPYRLLFEGR